MVPRSDTPQISAKVGATAPPFFLSFIGSCASGVPSRLERGRLELVATPAPPRTSPMGAPVDRGFADTGSTLTTRPSLVLSVERPAGADSAWAVAVRVQGG